jgi:DNA-binding HxlR family transcriptional regulator
MTMEKAQEGTGVLPSNLDVPSECRAISEVLSRVGDKWTVLVISALGGGPKRFGELRKSLGSISKRMLTLTLRNLERDGLVTRTVFPTVPPRVDYELTPLGRSLFKPVVEIAQWVRKHRRDIDKARLRFDKTRQAD